MTESDENQMKAVVLTAYGAPSQVLEVKSVPKPTCGANDVILRVRAASVNAGDWHIIRGDPWVNFFFSEF